jgi:hypothetical protein
VRLRLLGAPLYPDRHRVQHLGRLTGSTPPPILWLDRGVAGPVPTLQTHAGKIVPESPFEPSYYPHLWELVILLLTMTELLLAGTIARRQWTSQNEVMPVPVAVLLWVLMMGLYGCTTLSFMLTTEPERKFTLLVYCLGFCIPPLLYFTRLVADSVAVRTTDRLSPFGAQIDDPSEFAGARKLAIRGDIDGAVAMYRGYTDNKAAALFEAARLLKSRERLPEAIALYEEVAEHFYGRRRVWAEAMYNIGKIREVNFNDPETAMAIYHQILERTAESRHGQLAGADLSRLQVLDKGFIATLTGGDAAARVDDPFYRTRSETPGAATPPAVAGASTRSASPLDDDYDDPAEAGAARSEVDDDLVVPPVDPFLALRNDVGADGTAAKSSAGDGENGRVQRKKAAKAPKKPRPS